jgi:hypothetical protein
MTLQMYALSFSKAPSRNVDFREWGVRIHEWSDHDRLHDWMQSLYRRKGGRAWQFRNRMLVLDAADIDDLGHLIAARYFISPGQINDQAMADAIIGRDLEFIDRAHRVINCNHTVAYCACW